jgi:hypothetical protein
MRKAVREQIRGADYIKIMARALAPWARDPEPAQMTRGRSRSSWEAHRMGSGRRPR